MAPRAVLLVPRREDNGERDRLWRWLRYRWWEGIGLPIIEGHHDPSEGLFNRSAAINRAALAADTPRWDVAVVLDADTLVNPEAVHSALLLADASQQITWGFERFASLTPEGTEKILAGYEGDWEEFVAWQALNTASSCVAVPRPLWDQVGGFDEGHIGWGHEDVSFSLACQSIGGGRHRIAGTAYHLHHEPAEATGDAQHPIWQANQARSQAYIEAGWCNAPAMRRVLEANGQWRRFA